MDDSKFLAEKARSLIDRLQMQQALITHQFQPVSNLNAPTGILKKSKSVSFMDADEHNSTQAKMFNDAPRPRSILKKSDENLSQEKTIEPFVVNIPNNISRVNIDEYLRSVQDQRRRGLNYSYTTDDDDDNNDDDVDDDDDDDEKSYQDDVIERNMKRLSLNETEHGKTITNQEPWNEKKHLRSLLDEGNSRDAYNNSLKNSTDSQQLLTNENVNASKKQTKPRPRPEQSKLDRQSPKKRQQQTSLTRREKVLLGYDVVAGLLDNDKSSLLNDENRLSESYIDELVSFRKNNLDQSNSSYSLANEVDITDFSKEIDFLPADAYHNSHTCIHSFTINDRLFTVPTNPDSNGQSRCPVCHGLRKDLNCQQPQYARVSIPKYRVNTNNYKFRPQKRSSISDSGTHSVALANHCLAGFNTARVAPLDKSAKSLDLRTDSGKQLELSKMSLEDVQRLGAAHDLCETDLRRRSTTLRYHMNTLFQERLRHLRKSTNGPDNNASVISQIDVH